MAGACDGRRGGTRGGGRGGLTRGDGVGERASHQRMARHNHWRDARALARSGAVADWTWWYEPHCHSPLNVPMQHAHCRVAVRVALPLALDRTLRTATRPRAYPPHCHSAPNVLSALPLAPERAARYVHCQVAVRVALPLALDRTFRTATRPRSYRCGTLTVEWQCRMHCHSPLNVKHPYVHCRVAVCVASCFDKEQKPMAAEDRS